MGSYLKSKRLWLSFGISLAFFVLFFTTVDFRELFSALIHANYLYVVPGIGFYFVAVGFRTLRWKFLLSPLRSISTARLYPVVIVGYMANNLLPLRLGELVRSYYLSEREAVSKSAGLATILVERVFDGLVLLFFVAAIALILPLGGLIKGLGDSSGIPWLVSSIVLSLLFIITLILLILMAFYPPRLKGLVDRITSFIPGGYGLKLQELVELFIEGLSILRSPKNLVPLFLLSLPVWLFEAMLFFLIGFSFNFDEQFASIWQMAIAAILATSIANLGASVPSSPGGIGLFELFARETLVLLPMVAIDRAAAGAYAITVHAALIIPVILLGQLFLLIGHTSLLRLAKTGEQEASALSGTPTLSMERDKLS